MSTDARSRPPPWVRPGMSWWVAALSVSLVGSARTAHAEPEESPPLRYELDPVTDTVVLSVSLVSGVFSELTIGSGELPATTPNGKENIPFYDRWVVDIDNEAGARFLGDLGLWTVAGYAVFDTIHTGYRESAAEGWTEVALYLESALLNWTMANIVKLTVRRPRPRAYEEGIDLTMVNQELSFYSAHAAMTAGLAGTATYLAFVRDPDGWTPWATLVAGTAVTGFVAEERIRVKAHFLTDVLAGAVVGASVGVLIPHLHRRRDDTVRAFVWADGESAMATVSLRY